MTFTIVEMYELIKKQMEKERFWETDEQFLYDAGELILDIGAENDFSDAPWLE